MTSNSVNSLVFKKLIAFFFIAIYLFVLFNLPNDLFRDRAIYIIIAEDSKSIFSFDSSEFKYFTNEPLFLYLADLFNSYPKIFPVFMGCFVGLVYCFYLERYSSNLIIFILGFLFLLFNTFLIYPQVMQLRQGFATALFLIIIFSVRSTKYKILFSLFLPFIHIIFLVIIPIFVYYELYLKYKDKFLIFVNIATISLFLSIFAFALMYAVGVRQAEQYDGIGSSFGGGAFLLHIFLLIYFYFFVKKDNNYIYNWALIGLTIYIFSYFFLPSPGRVLVSFYPFILYALVAQKTVLNYIVFLILLFVFIVLFFNGGLEGMLTLPTTNFYFEFVKHFSNL